MSYMFAISSFLNHDNNKYSVYIYFKERRLSEAIKQIILMHLAVFAGNSKSDILITHI